LSAKSSFEGLATESIFSFYIVQNKATSRSLYRVNCLQPHPNFTVIPNKTEYKLGDIAQILVTVIFPPFSHSPFQAPFSPCEGYWAIGFDSYTSTGRLSIKEGDSSTIVEIAISEEHCPNFQFIAEMIGTEPRTSTSQLRKNAYGFASTAIAVSKVNISFFFEISHFFRNSQDFK
jgi:hypothetical protein